MAEQRWLQHRGHRFEVAAAPAAGGDGTEYTLTVDRRVVDRRTCVWRDPRWVLDDLDTGLPLDELGLAGARIQVTSWRTGRIGSCHLVRSGAAAGAAAATLGLKPDRIPFVPPAGSRAHRRHAWADAHPRLHAARHVALALGQVALLVLGVRLALGLLAWGWVPNVDLPNVDLPNLSLGWLPDWTPPGWLQVLLDRKPYWLPVLVALYVGRREYRRRQEARAEAAADRSAEPDVVAVDR